jgi:hypothetical protein
LHHKNVQKQKPPRLTGTAFQSDGKTSFLFTATNVKSRPQICKRLKASQSQKNSMKKKQSNIHSPQIYAITGEQYGIDFQFARGGNQDATM